MYYTEHIECNEYITHWKTVQLDKKGKKDIDLWELNSDILDLYS